MGVEFNDNRAPRETQCSRPLCEFNCFEEHIQGSDQKRVNTVSYVFTRYTAKLDGGTMNISEMMGTTETIEIGSHWQICWKKKNNRKRNHIQKQASSEKVIQSM